MLTERAGALWSLDVAQAQAICQSYSHRQICVTMSVTHSRLHRDNICPG